VVVAPDSEFVMSVARSSNEVTITLTFSKDFDFDYASIERKPEFEQSFSQCKHISSAELKPGSRQLVKKDIYPYPGTVDVLYRIKMASKDGGIRIYPAVRLPAFNRHE
jgi:hypothetical protein